MLTCSEARPAWVKGLKQKQEAELKSQILRGARVVAQGSSGSILLHCVFEFVGHCFTSPPEQVDPEGIYTVAFKQPDRTKGSGVEESRRLAL